MKIINYCFYYFFGEFIAGVGTISLTASACWNKPSMENEIELGQ
jgi:hypothetical protein